MIRTTCLRAAGIAVALIALLLPSSASEGEALGGYPGHSLGYDISYPQCGREYPPKPFGFIIVGVNGGKPMTPNPCFAHQVSYARQGAMPPSLYVNTSAPPLVYSDDECGDDFPCTAYSWGVAAAKYALTVAEDGGAGDIDKYWLDVETANYWTANKVGNAWAVSAMKTTLEEAGKTVGIYSTSYQYGLITGNYLFPGTPLWIPGWSDPGDDHIADCKSVPLFAGGYAAMLQWTLQFDGNYACPGNRAWIVDASHQHAHP